MSGFLRKRFYLSAEEFAVCCSAAGISRLCGFPMPLSGQPQTASSLGMALFAMQRDGLMLTEGDSYKLCPELSTCVRRIAGGKITALAFRERYDIPCSLLYGGADGYVSLEPGVRPGEYAGLARYETDELSAWISDAGLVLPAPAGDWETPPSEDEEEELRTLQKLLRGTCWPPDGGLDGRALLEKLRGCVEFRGASEQELLGRIYLLQTARSCWLLTESGSGLAGEKYDLEKLTSGIHDRMEEAEK